MGLLASGLVAACATPGGSRPVELATAQIKGLDNAAIGTAILLSAGDAVRLLVIVAGQAGKTHGLHLHAVGTCAAPFASAGPHLNPTGHQHGSDNPAGSHLGDLPNLTLDAKGAGSLTTQLRGTRAELEAAIFDADGTAIVLHAAPDDYRTDPSGNSGARIACGAFVRR
jgi:Cu-Zn family superoxide dismutase